MEHAMRSKRGPPQPYRPRKLLAGLIGLAGLAGTAPSSAAVEQDRSALSQRLEAVRAAIQAERRAASHTTPAAELSSSWLAQWGNWSNWANWRN